MPNIPELIKRSRWLREELFEMVIRTRKGHIPSCYSCAEIVCALFYGGVLKYDAVHPKSRDRDTIIVSKGHASMVLYPILADLGFYPKEELQKFTRPDGILRMYADHSIPGIEAICGSLGHGFTIGAGLAFANKKDKKDFKSYVIVGDGECYEGSIWETAMFASHYELDNLVVIVDRNRLCILNDTEQCIKLDPMEDKWKAFGWNATTINGHSYKEIFQAFDTVAKSNNKKPTAIIANSVKGKGISFMENKSEWHNRMPDAGQINLARENLAAFTLTE